jgi:hypothetical protein
MLFPAKPTCHHGHQRPIGWAEPRRDDQYGIWEPFRRCDYCGSIHPEDLIKFLGEGATLDGADWKYGWPHKFYVRGIRNQYVGDVARVGTSFSAGKETAILGAPPKFCWSKWYNEHIMDEGYDDEARGALLSLLEQSGITFKIQDGRLIHISPSFGFQK